jgi:hypothetical protein
MTNKKKKTPKNLILQKKLAIKPIPKQKQLQNKKVTSNNWLFI